MGKYNTMHNIILCENVRQHTVVGANRILFSAHPPTRLCWIGMRWSSIFVTFTLKKIIDWNISFQTVSCIHLMNVDVYDCNSHIHNPTCFHLTLDLFQTDSVV